MVFRAKPYHIKWLGIILMVPVRPKIPANDASISFDFPTPDGVT